LVFKVHIDLIQHIQIGLHLEPVGVHLEDVGMSFLLTSKVTSAVRTAEGQLCRVRHQMRLERRSRVTLAAFRARVSRPIRIIGDWSVFDGSMEEQIDLPLTAIGTLLARERHLGRRRQRRW